MAVMLRLARYGQKKRAFYRVVAADKECRRDGRFIEVVGTYNPMVDPPAVTLKEDRVRRWLDNGAKATMLVRSLIVKSFPGLVESKEKHAKEKIRQQRSKRKQRIAARAQ